VVRSRSPRNPLATDSACAIRARSSVRACLDLEPGGVDVGFEHGATCALALQRVFHLLELAAGHRGGRASLFEQLPLVVRFSA
jgi:hypothetical protein